MAHILPDSSAGCFPNPCPVCGATDEHAEWAEGVADYSPATFCPHPRERGHGTGCCCAGRPKPLTWPFALPGGSIPPLTVAEWSMVPMGTGPRHDRTGTVLITAHIGGEGYRATLEVMTWTGCNGQRCARDCGPGHHAVLSVPCQFAVGNRHHYTLSDEEIAGLRKMLGALP